MSQVSGIVYVFVFVIAFVFVLVIVFVVGQVISPHHSDQVSQRSQVSGVTLLLCFSKGLSVSEWMSESVTRSPIELSAGQLKTSCCSSQTFLYLAIASTACWNPTAGYESYVHADQFLTCPVNRQMVNVLQATCLSMLHATSYKLHTNQFFQFSLCPINMQMVNVLQGPGHH